MQSIINKIVQSKFNVLLVKSLAASDIFAKVKEQFGQTYKDHTDIVSISDPSVEEIRQLKQFMQQAPSVLPFKYVLINKVDMLNKSSANALLQILEEPPLTLKIILFSYHQYVLPTILSRCKILDIPIEHNKLEQSQDEALVKLHEQSFEDIKQFTNTVIIKYFTEHAYKQIIHGKEVAKYYKLYQEAIRLYKKNCLEKIAISKIILFNYLKNLC